MTKKEYDEKSLLLRKAADQIRTELIQFIDVGWYDEAEISLKELERNAQKQSELYNEFYP